MSRNVEKERKFNKKEQKWRNVTESFSERQRHYKNTYLEICEVFDEVVEVSVFSSVTDPYEIYFSYGRFYGIIYAEKDEAYIEFEKVKHELEAEYRKHEEPTGKFINDFARRHKVCMPNDILFDTDAFFDAFM